MILGSFINTISRRNLNGSYCSVKNICDSDFLKTSVFRAIHLQSQRYDSKREENETSLDGDKENILDKEKANALIFKLNEEERVLISNALKEFESNKMKEEYAGQLAPLKWRSKFGRPSKVPTLGDVDPTGSYCHIPEDWLIRKYAAIVPKPTNPQLIRVLVYNAIPFVGFGFLDNAVMILCGDYIELKVGCVMTISTMAAAALGNCFSDILGLGSAYYVERLANALGFKAPNLSPVQMNMKSTTRSANLGRALGVTVGCILGMFPLLLL